MPQRRYGWLLGRAPLGQGQGGSVAAPDRKIGPPYYLVNDTFTTARLAGAINGTNAEPGPGRRVVVDTENKLSLSGGDLTPAGGKTVPAYNDPYLYYEKARSAGKVAVFALNVPNLTKRAVLGFGLISPGTIQNTAIFLINAEIRADSGPGFTWVIVGALTVAEHKFAVVQRTAGGFHFQWVGGVPLLLWVDNLETSGGSVGFGNYDATYAYHYLRVPSLPWLPVPLVSDGFSLWGTADGFGHAEGVAGALGAGGGGVAIVGSVGTWGAAAGVASASALGGGVAIATTDSGKANVLATANVTRAAGNVGVVVRYVDALNYVYAIHTGTQVTLRKMLAGVDSQVMAPANATYVAGAQVRVICDGTSFRCFFNNLAIGAAQTIADAALQTGTRQGLYTSDAGNTFDNLLVWARGSGGEYSALDAF